MNEQILENGQRVRGIYTIFSMNNEGGKKQHCLTKGVFLFYFILFDIISFHFL